MDQIQVKKNQAAEDKKKKKGGGFLGWLRGLGKGNFEGAVGGLGEGAAGSGAFGGLGGLADAGLAGGLLATKAGLIGLILIGTTVAGGLGVLGYRFFGPGADGPRSGGYNLFEQKPPSAATEAGPGADGNSKSLSMLAAGNAAPAAKEPPKAASTETADKPKADAAVAAGHSNNTNVFGNKAAALKTDRKIGDLSKLGGAGSGGSGSSASMVLPPATQAHASNGSAKGIPNKATPVSSGRAIGRRLGTSGAIQQLGQVRRDNASAPSSSAAGATYDGAKPSSTIGADAGNPAVGSGDSSGAASRPNPTNGSDSGNRFPAPPAADHTNVTPWQGAINTAMMCIAGAAMLLFAANKMKQADPTSAGGKGQSVNPMVYVLAGIAAMLALMAIALGSMMSGGKYGQKFQGQMFVLSGALMLATAAATMAFAGQGAGAKPGSTDQAKETFDPSMIMLLSGGASLAAAMAGYLSKPTKVDSTFFKNGKPPDFMSRHIYQRIERAPSDAAMDAYRMV